MDDGMRMHADELTIDDSLVRRLLSDRLPQHAGLPVSRLESSGSSNALFRLGPELLVRLPRQPGGSATILKEARWSPLVADALPVPTPYVVAVGEPGHGYPEHWSVVRWLPGTHPSPVAAGPRAVLARDLADVVRSLRATEVPEEARRDPALRSYRADPLATMDASFRADVETCRRLPDLDLDLDAALFVWDRAQAPPTAATPQRRSWLHGDLLAENLLVDDDDRLAAVLDLGGLAVGDPTVDLAVAWELLDASGRAVFREIVGVDDHTWERGRAWALALAMMTFAYYWPTMPVRCAARRSMARRVLEDAAAD